MLSDPSRRSKNLSTLEPTRRVLLNEQSSTQITNQEPLLRLNSKFSTLAAPRPIKVLPGGKPLSTQTPVFEFDLNKEMAQLYVYKNGMKADSRPLKEVQVQKRLYEYGLSKVLD